MRQLMISLDKKILDPTSAAARRMVEYGKNSELYIVIPNAQKTELDLSSTVHVYSSGGSSKMCQFFKTCKTARGLAPKFKIESVTTQDPFFTGLLGLRISHKFKIPLEVQVHGDFFGSDYYCATLFGKIKIRIAKFILRHADSIRVVGERVRQSIVATGIPGNKIVLRPVPVDFVAINEQTLPGDWRNKYPNFDKIFVFLGRFDPVKNISWLVDVFAEAVKKNPRSLLLIVGDGPLRSQLKEKIEGLALPNIQLEKWEVLPLTYYQNADCILFPSLSEGYGLVPMEAHALGKPVIMNDVGVANYELKPSDKVTILPINDKEKWIQAILSI